MPMNPRLLKPTASGFSPRSISGLALWLDAADSSTITTGTGVSQWRDKSASGSVWAQGTGNNQPATGTQTLNGRNVLVFDGTNDSLTSTNPYSAAMPASLFIVLRLISKSSFARLWSTDAVGFYLVQQSTTGLIRWDFSGATWSTYPSDATGVTVIATAVLPTSGSGESRFNGVAASSNTARPPAVAFTGVNHIGSQGAGNYSNFWLAEMGWYTRDISTLERAKLEKYLAGKWGVTLP